MSDTTYRPVLTFAELRRANTLRLPVFKNRLGKPAHAEPDGSDWSLSDWFTAFAGEIGEVLQTTGPAALADEVADAIIYLDLLAKRAGVTLDQVAQGHWERPRKDFDFDYTPFTSFDLAHWMAPALLLGDAIKKVNRGDRGAASLRYHLAKALEGLAGLAVAYRINLSDAIAEKFNRTSTLLQLPVFLVIDADGPGDMYRAFDQWEGLSVAEEDCAPGEGGAEVRS